MTTIEIATNDFDQQATKPDVMVVDDDPSILNLLRDLLSDKYNCVTASSADEALRVLGGHRVGVVVSDVNMGGMNGLDLIPAIHQLSPDTVAIMMSGERDMDVAIRAVQIGAFDYLRKPFDLDDVSSAVERAVDRHKVQVQTQAQSVRMRELVDSQKDQLDFLKSHDPVTGLANREFFVQQASRAIADARVRTGNAAVVFLALDRFQSFKETIGSDSGEAILQEIAGRWLDLIPADSTLARFENDEFGLLLPRLEYSFAAVELIRNLKDALQEPISVEGRDINLNVNAGISVYPNDGENMQRLERSAATALSQARRSGPNVFRFHKPEMNETARRRLAVECGLRRALQNGELSNYYQPKIDFATGKVVGMEALIRWHSRELGLVSPGEIIPIAEEIGLAESIGLWALETACRHTSELIDQGFDLKVSVNLSGKQLADSWLPSLVETAVTGAGLATNRLELEITETSLIENSVTAIALLNTIRSAGVSVAIDDFGTGFSSLGYLKTFPLDTLKIDRSFVQDLESGTNCEFVYAIVSLAQKLGLKTVVEGVETVQQLELLRAGGCDEWQGFLCSKPVPFDGFKALLSAGRFDTPASALLSSNLAA